MINLFAAVARSIRTKSQRRARASKKSAKKALRLRNLRLEGLEERALLSVTQGEYAEIRDAYPALNLPETADKLNVIEIEAANLTVDSLKAAIADAGTTTNDDLIVVRTTDEANTVTYASESDEIKINVDSSQYGALDVVAFGTQPLTINAAQQSRVLRITGGTIGLANLTLTGGKATNYDVNVGMYGGGIYLTSVLQTTNVAISENYAECGGGVFVNQGFFTATNTTIANNVADYGEGGGVYVSSGSFTTTNGTIVGNSAYYGGGGVYVDSTGSFAATNTTIAGNCVQHSDCEGGGVYVRSGSFTATNTTIAGNIADYGGGVYVLSGSFTSTNTTLSENRAEYGGGGGVYICSGSFVATNTIISGNYAVYGDGGGVCVGSASFTATNTTIAGNSAEDGGGVYVTSDGSFNATNVILSANYGSNISGTLSSESSNNLIDYLPCFVCAPVFDENGRLTNSKSFDLHLRSDSPAIDAGSNEAVVLSTDLDGCQRVYNGTVDIGAYEYQGNRKDEPFYSTIVDTLNDSFDLNDGEWSLREAIYYASKYETITFAENLSGTISLTRGELLFDKELAVDGDGRIVIDAGKKSRVAYIDGGTEETPIVLNGLTLQNGKTSDNGGGVYLYSGVLTTTNTTISGNSSSNGGGVYVFSGAFTSINTTISENSASKSGGGVYVAFGAFTATDTTISENTGRGVYLASGSFEATNTTISENSGGVYVGEGSFISTNTTISGNSSEFGSGVYVSSGGSFVSTNTTIAENSTTRTPSYLDTVGHYLGGGVYVAGVFTATNTAIWGNYAYQNGGGVYVASGSFTSTNSTITGNAARYGGDGVYVAEGSCTMKNSIVSMNYYGSNLYGELSSESSNNIIDYCPSFVCEPVFDENVKLTNADSLDLRLKSCSVAIDAGSNVPLEGVVTDLDGKRRVYNETVDIGAYEYQGDRNDKPFYSTVVDTLNDSFDLNDGEWSLREAIYYAPKYETITFAENLNGTISLTKGQLQFDKTLTVDGNGRIVIDAGQNSRVAYVNSGTEETPIVLKGLTLQNGKTSGSNGGGVYLAGVLQTVNVTITRNSAYTNSYLHWHPLGGGVYVVSGSFTAINTTISGNSSYDGGGVYVASGRFMATNATISGNSAFNFGGGGVYVEEGAFTATNSIVSLNDGFNLYGRLSSESSNNLIDYYPSFVCDPVFDENGKLTNADSIDLRLKSCSVAIDAGSNDAVSELSTDLDGNPRVYNGAVDIGASEYQGDRKDVPFYSTVVDTLNDSFDSNDGEWSLREAIYYASEYETITFAKNLHGTISLTKGQLFLDKALVIDGDGRIVIDAGKKSRVAYAYGGTEETPIVLKGLTLQNGKTSKDGGGVYISGVVSATNTTISGNSGTIYDGGGVYVAFGSFTAINTTISGNSASEGGGVYVASGSFTATNATITGNSADYSGGGVYVDPGSFTSTNTTISGNSAGSWGGGVYVGNGSFTSTNTTVSGNSADYDGGGVYVRYGQSIIYNSIIVHNTSKKESSNDISRNGNISITGSNNLSTFTGWDGSNNYEYNEAEPLFVNSDIGDYRLVSGSQAIDKGNNQYAYDAGMDETWTNSVGEPRFSGSAIDIGADEFFAELSVSQNTIYVGDVTISWSKYKNASSVRLIWSSGTTENVLGAFESTGSYTWNTRAFNDGYGVLLIEYLDENGEIVSSVEYSALILNDENVVVCRGTIAESENWNADKVYVVVGKLDVKSGATLTINQSVVVKFCKNAYIDVNDGATLDVGNVVTLTRLEDDTVGGDTNRDGSLSVPKIGNAYVRGTGTTNLASTVITKYIPSTAFGALQQDETWANGQVYHVTGTVVVPSGVTLTIMPGAIVKFDAGCSLIVQSGGKLVADGTKSQPIVFTSIKDDEYGGDLDEDDGENTPAPGDWSRISCEGGTVTLNHTIVRYCSDTAGACGGLNVTGGSMSFDNSVLEHTLYYGVNYTSNDCVFNARNSLFRDNATCMFNFHARGKATLTNCTIIDGVSFLNIAYDYSDTLTNCVIANFSESFERLGSSVNYSNCAFYNSDESAPGSFKVVGSNGNIWANPQFVDAANGNYRLSAGSPCIDAGTLEGAPDVDADGTPRYDDLYMPNNGDSCVDIGAYEFADGSSSSIDLEPVDLQAPATANVGETITVQWTIRNNGTVAATGDWRDSFYLISSTGRKVAVQDVVLARSVASGDMQTFYAKIVVPNVEEGEWTLGVTVNPNREIYEGANVENNALVATNVTTILTESLQLPLEELSLKNGGEFLRRVTIPAGESFYLIADSSEISMKVRENYAPTSALYDAQSIVYDDQAVLKIDAADVERLLYVSITASAIGVYSIVKADKYEPPVVDTSNAFDFSHVSVTLDCSATRPKRITRYSIKVTNNGDFAVVAPLVVLQTKGEIAWDADDFLSNMTSTSLTAFAFTNDGDFTLLKPGETVSIPFYYRSEDGEAPLSGQMYKFKEETTFKTSEDSVWSTYGEYFTAISDAAKILKERGELIRDEITLRRFALARAKGEDTTGVAGFVLDQTGSGVADASIVATWQVGDETFDLTTNTDENGRFTFNYLPSNARVSIQASDYDSVEPVEVTLKDGADVLGVKINVPARYSVGGTVKTAVGRGVDSVSVKAIDENGRVVFAQTNKYGAYSFDTLETGVWTISLVDSAYAGVDSQTVEITAGGSVASVAFVVPMSFALVVKFTSKDGLPLEGYYVQLDAADESTYGVYTDENGAIQFDRIAVGAYTGTFFNDEFQPVYSFSVTVDNSDVEANYVVDMDAALVSFSGRVCDANGAALDGLTVLFQNDYEYKTVETDENGVFKLDSVSRCSFTLKIQGVSKVWSFETAPTEGERFELTTSHQASIRGKLADADGSPICANIYLRRVGEEEISCLPTDNEGNYYLLLKEIGDFELWYASASGVTAPQKTTILKGANVWSPVVMTNEITVNLSGLPSSPTDDAKIEWNLYAIDENDNLLAASSDSVAFGNSFDLRNLTEGKYVLCARYNNYRSETSFEVGAETPDVTLDFIEGFTVDVVVSAPEGVDLESNETRVWVYDENNRLVYRGNLDEDGRIVPTLYEDGTYTFVFLGNEYLGKKTVEILRTGTNHVEVTLEKASIFVSGVLKSEGEVVSNAIVYITDKNDVAVGYGSSDENGEFKIAVFEATGCTLGVVSFETVSYNVEAGDINSDVERGEIELVKADYAVESSDSWFTSSENKQNKAYDVLVTGNLWPSGNELPIDWTSEAATMKADVQDQVNYAGSLEHKTAHCTCDKAEVDSYNCLVDEIKRLANSLQGIFNEIKSNGDFQYYLASSISKYVESLDVSEYESASKKIDGLRSSIISEINKVASKIGISSNNIERLRDLVQGTVAAVIPEITSLINLIPSIKQKGSDLTKGFSKSQLDSLRKNSEEADKHQDRLNSIMGNYLTSFKLELESLKNSIFDSWDEYDERQIFKDAYDVFNTIDTLNNACYALYELCNFTSEIDVGAIKTHTHTLDSLVTKFDGLKQEYQNLLVQIKEKRAQLQDPKQCECTDGECGDSECGDGPCRCLTSGPCTCGGNCKCGDNPPPTPDPDDPNEIIGPIGYDYVTVNTGTEDEPFAVITSPNWISLDSDSEQSYKICFENKSSATAAAQEVFVTTQLPEGFDWSSFELREIGVGSQVFDELNGYSDGVWTVNQTSTGDQIQITVDYDPTTGLAKWYLRSYVTSTIDHFPTNAYAGFLPPNNEEEGDGQGYVSFVVKLDANLTTGAKVETNATIVFDVNEAITTNTWLNTIDADAPTVALVSVGADDEPGTATLVCESSDVGSGVASYDVYYSVDGGVAFTKWNSISESTITFEAPVAGDYLFYVVALDGVGNVATSEISTSVSLSAYVGGEAPVAPDEITFGVYDKTTQSVSVSWIDASFDEDNFRIEISSDGENWTLVGTPEADSTSTTINVPGAGNYTVRVCAENSNGASDWTTAELTLVLPEAPDGITFGDYDAANKSVSVGWIDASSDELNFRVEISSDWENWALVGTPDTDATSTTIENLGVGTYIVRVCAENLVGASDWATAELIVGESGDGFSPSNLTPGVYNPATRRVSMSWIDHCADETGFRVEYSTDGGVTWRFSDKLGANVTSRFAWRVMPNMEYNFRVCALRDGVKSEWAYSETLDTTVVLPNAPGGLTLGDYDATTQTVSMSWSDNSDDELGFRVEYSKDGGETWLFAEFVDANVSSRVAWAVHANKTYMFRVCALREGVTSDWAYSDPLDTSVPKLAAPGDLTIGEYDAASQTVSMSWTDNSDDETGVRVEYSKDGGETWLFAEALAADSTYRVAWGVRANLTYDFRVCSVRGNERSEWAYSTTTLDTSAASVSNASFDVPYSGDYALALPVAVPLVEQKAVRVALIQDAFEDSAFLQFESDVDFTPEYAGEAGESELFVDLFNDDLLEVRF